MNWYDKAAIEAVLKYAHSQVGYQALPFNNTVFGTKTGTQGLPWDAPFIRAVFEECGFRLDAASRATSLYEEFVTENSIYSDPKVGDIAFFAWGSGLQGDGQPHVGIVSDTAYWKSHRRFRAIEATEDKVQDLLRFNTDVLAFGRPGHVFFSKGSGDDPRIKLSDFSGVQSKSYIPIQRALEDLRALAQVKYGHWDRQCESAYASWQRHIGMVKADGKLELDGLRALGYASGRFTIEA